MWAEAVCALLLLLGVWLLMELAVRLYIEWPLATSFYGSIARADVPQLQERYGVQVAIGHGWAHLGWIADPDAESYRIERLTEAGWQTVGEAALGSYVVRRSGQYRVWAQGRASTSARLLGAVTAEVTIGAPPVHVPRIAGAWRPLFRPRVHGDYINDHTVYRDAGGSWRVMGITAHGRGDFARERYFAVGVGPDFPPAQAMQEAPPVADSSELAWAPHVIEEAGTYYVFWSPHRLHRMTSPNAINWADHRVVLAMPFHKFFRDPMVLKVADGQWLLYTTARGTYFSQVDVYQSFDLEGWQYIGTALRTGWGSERNAIFASTESPFVVCYRDRFYLSLTYNNNSFFWTALLLPLKVWLNKRSYNDTLVFHADNPYDFGEYRGRRRAPSLIARLEAHAAEFVHNAELDAWYITTAGWPWVATLTSGEVAVAPLRWDAVDR
jgi:arabinan endo-1,5-alpha-L-arabinosidase